MFDNINMWLILLLITPYFVKVLEGCKSKSVTTTTTTVAATSTYPTTVYSPSIATSAESIKVMKGDDFSLTCVVDNLDGNQITWKKDDKILVVDEEVFEDNIDAEKKDDGSIITIKKAKEEDGGEYVCHVLAEKLTHEIDIIVRPEVVPVPLSGLVTARVGDNVTLGCNITRGGPGTFLSWAQVSQSWDYPLFWDDIQTITEVQKWHSGLYRCTASNKWPETAVAEVRIEVEYPPDVDITASTDYTWKWTRLEPECFIDAYPESTVEWFKDGERVEDLETDIIQDRREKNKYSSKITLTDMGLGYRNTNTSWRIGQDKLGVYECRVKNNLGQTSAALEVFNSCDRETQQDCYRIVKKET